MRIKYVAKTHKVLVRVCGTVKASRWWQNDFRDSEMYDISTCHDTTTSHGTMTRRPMMICHDMRLYHDMRICHDESRKFWWPSFFVRKS